MQKIIIYICGIILLAILSGCTTLVALKASQFENYKNACKQGEGDKCYSLGRMYMEGIGTKKSFYKAREAYKKGCENEHNSNACREYGQMKAHSLGEWRDDYINIQPLNNEEENLSLYSSQYKSYKVNCNQGDGDKCYGLGRMYMQGIGTEKSYTDAREAFTKGCEKSNKHTLDSCYALGKIYIDGLGVRRDYVKAKRLFEHTCKGEYMKGCGDLGHMYLYAKGVKQNNTMAINLLSKSCKQGNAKSCSTLGTLYITGQNVKEDYKQAHELFDKACRNGDALGCYNMGNIYENGIGRAQNQDDAIQFYSLACSGGLNEGCQSLKLLQDK